VRVCERASTPEPSPVAIQKRMGCRLRACLLLSLVAAGAGFAAHPQLAVDAGRQRARSKVCMMSAQQPRVAVVTG
jgi:hypothetical protein